jgi:hypothetical protein
LDPIYKYPSIRTKYVEDAKANKPLLRTKLLFDAISSTKNKCKAGIMPTKFLTQAELDGSFCPFERLGDELLEIRSGLVISSDRLCMLPTIDALISSMVTDAVMDDAAELFFHKSECGESEEEEEEEEGDQPLGIANFAGLFFFHTALAVIAYAFQHFQIASQIKLHNPLEMEKTPRPATVQQASSKKQQKAVQQKLSTTSWTASSPDDSEAASLKPEMSLL